MGVASVPFGFSLFLCRNEAGVVCATAGVDTLAVAPAVVDKIVRPEHRANGHEAFPAEFFFRSQGAREPLCVGSGHAVSVFHEGHNLLIALGLEPGEPDVGDALLAQVLQKFFVHGRSFQGRV
jgi:hypothetical protein